MTTGWTSFCGMFSNPEKPGIIEFELEQSVGAFAGRTFEQKLNLEIRVGDLPRVDIHLNGDVRRLGLRPERARRIRILEGKILRILHHGVERGRVVPHAPPFPSAISLLQAASAPNSVAAGSMDGPCEQAEARAAAIGLVDPPPILWGKVDHLRASRQERGGGGSDGAMHGASSASPTQSERKPGKTRRTAPSAARTPLSKASGARRSGGAAFEHGFQFVARRPPEPAQQHGTEQGSSAQWREWRRPARWHRPRGQTRRFRRTARGRAQR